MSPRLSMLGWNTFFPGENGHGESDASVNVKVCGRSRDI